MENITGDQLSRVRVPTSRDKVYKDECVYSFDNPESEEGLYVSLVNFIGLGRDYVADYYHKTGVSMYLHIKRTKREVSTDRLGDGPEKKISKLAIGVEGGFSGATKKKYEYDEAHELVIMPEFKTIPLPNPNLPTIVNESIAAILALPSASKMAEIEALSGTWDGEIRLISKFAGNLEQIDNGIKIPPRGWRCEKCYKTDNLWLNLTDGSILCGRRFFDGTGGNNHAVDHYAETNYPLAVKLGTITKDGKGDVFSYKEDDMVVDPFLVQHLAHWGINITQMEKTEKSMVELELELNQKREWASLTENNVRLEPIYGPGYTGMVNMGNSCYLNSVMQLMFSIPSFIEKYYNGSFKYFFNERMSADPAAEFNIQMSKLAVGLLSGRYSVAPSRSRPDEAAGGAVANLAESDEIESPSSTGICPVMFKNLVGYKHAEFSTKRQQDVQEFMLHLFNLLATNNKNQDNPGDCFRFMVEDRFQCGASKMVKYTTKTDLILAFNIPMEAVLNKDEVAVYEEKKASKAPQWEQLQIVRPQIDFNSCLEMYTRAETIDNFYSTAVNHTVTATKTTRLSTFPDFLIIQLKKFQMCDDWSPMKLDVSVDMPEVLDISGLRGIGCQPGEELLPEPKTPPPTPEYDAAVLAQLEDMGFPTEACKRAIFNTKNTGLEAATQWIMTHITDSDFTDPFIPPGTECSTAANQFQPDPSALRSIIEMGFVEKHAIQALTETNNNLEMAMDWICAHPSNENNGTPMETDHSDGKAKINDGQGQYKLVGFISHMGTSTNVGHYVVHLLKNGKWVIFNDEKVAFSEHPPKDLGYIYLYERL